MKKILVVMLLAVLGLSLAYANYKVTTNSANCAAKTANCRIVAHPYLSLPRPFMVVFDRISAIKITENYKF